MNTFEYNCIVITYKLVFGNNFWLNKAPTFILPASCSFCQDASKELWFEKVRLKIWPRSRSMSRSWRDRKRWCGISVDPYRRPEHIGGVFIALACLYQPILFAKWFESQIRTNDSLSRIYQLFANFNDINFRLISYNYPATVSGKNMRLIIMNSCKIRKQHNYLRS